MNNLKTLKNIKGKKAYADGYYGFIHAYEDGEYILNTERDGSICTKKIKIIDRLSFLFIKNNITVAIAIVDGLTYIGSVACKRRDEEEEYYAKRLALATAFRDERSEDNIFDEMTDSCDYGDDFDGTENIEEEYTIVKTEEI